MTYKAIIATKDVEIEVYNWYGDGDIGFMVGGAELRLSRKQAKKLVKNFKAVLNKKGSA